MSIEKYINKVHCMDCIEIMKELPDNCVDLTLTSPPYDNLRDYKNGIGKSWNFEIFKPIAKELYRITKKGGVIVWVVGDATINGSETGTSFKQALYFKEIGFNLHDTMIYCKDPRFPMSNKYGQSFEYMFILAKEKIKTFNPIKRDNLQKAINKLVTNRKKSGELFAKRYSNTSNESSLYNVWYYSSGYMKTTKDIFAYEHPAMFPEQLVEDHIISWSNKGDIVFDPFMGSGTTAKMAIVNDRNFIGCEISQEYCDIANARIEAERSQLKLPIN